MYVLSQLGMMHAKANPPEHSRMNTIKLGMLLPHEVASSLYHFRSGELFYSLLAGTPEEIGSKSSIINVFGQLEVLNQFKIKLCMLLYAFTILYAVCMCMGLPWPGQCFVLGKQPRLSWGIANMLGRNRTNLHGQSFCISPLWRRCWNNWC